MTKLFQIVNAILKPLGLVLYTIYEVDEDSDGMPTKARIVGARFARRDF